MSRPEGMSILSSGLYTSASNLGFFRRSNVTSAQSVASTVKSCTSSARVMTAVRRRDFRAGGHIDPAVVVARPDPNAPATGQFVLGAMRITSDVPSRKLQLRLLQAHPKRRGKLACCGRRRPHQSKPAGLLYQTQSHLHRDKSSGCHCPGTVIVIVCPTHGHVLLSLCRLTSRELPDPKHIRLLVNYYFQNFHPLRCFAFVHKPSFLRKLVDNFTPGLLENALLHIMCAIGAQCVEVPAPDICGK